MPLSQLNLPSPVDPKIRLWRQLRLIAGWFCVIVGVLGIILPIIPGAPLLILGISLIGRRDPTLRWWIVHCKLSLRRLIRIRIPWVSQNVQRAWRIYRQTVSHLKIFN